MTTARRLLACLTIAAFSLTLGAFAADEKKTPTNKEIMASFKGKDNILGKTDKAATAGKWEDAQKYSKELKDLGEAIGKNTPKKGANDKESWTKHTKLFTDGASAISDATDKKDAKAVSASVKKFQAICSDCHKSHK